MVTVRPFKGLRPRKELAARVAAPPYDVLSSEEAREMAKNNPYSFLHVNKPEIDLEPGIDLYDPRVYRKGAENLKRLIQEGVMVQDQEPRFYVYQQVMGRHRQVGLVACASVEEYEAGLIKKHEHTRPEKEDDRVRHIDHLNAQVGPVFLTYRAREEIDRLMEGIVAQEPEYDFTGEDGVRHTLWVVSHPELIARIQQAFRRVEALYVADGHHRSAAAMRVKRKRQAENPHHTGEEEYNYFLVVIFPHNQMQILDYNRVVRDLKGLKPTEFFEKLREKFLMEEQPPGQVYKPNKPHTFGMYVSGKWYKLTARRGTFDERDPVQRLDVSILQENILRPILGIQDPRKDKRIDFVGGIRGMQELQRRVDCGDWAVAFALYPTAIGDLMAIADAGKVMPPKSTWFEPKLKSGLVVHLLD